MWRIVYAPPNKQIIPCVPMCILSTLSALNSIENYYYHIEFRMDSVHIGTQAKKEICILHIIA